MAKISNPDRVKHREYDRVYYQRHKASRKANADRQRRKVTDALAQYKLSCACACGETHPACLDFHHRDPVTKRANICDMARAGFGWESILEEIAKCDVMCANCHRKHHWNETVGVV